LKLLIKRTFFAIPALLVTGWSYQAQSDSASGRWNVSAEMAAPRASACSVALSDGRLLVAGGSGAAGTMNSVDLYATDASRSQVSPMAEARANATCTLLNDGRVLVTGGSNENGVLNSAEVYDPVADTWKPAGTMAMARSGHTATRMPWGAVLVVGGEDTGTAEAYLTNGTFLTLGKLSTPRTDYAVAVLPDNRILIAGGATASTALPAIDIFDARDNSIQAGGNMLTARRNFAAATLYDGTVIFIGGYDENGKTLATTEIFDPVKAVSVAGPELAQARAGHQALTLPNNGKVLIVGGSNGYSPLATAEIYSPATGKLEPAASMHSARTSMAAAVSSLGSVFIAGGKGENGLLSGAEAYHFATIESNRQNYGPGEIPQLRGRGWKPGEQVLLTAATFPLDQHRSEFTAMVQADDNGQWTFAGFKVDSNHLGQRFLVTAIGNESQAQTMFMDAESTTTSIDVSDASLGDGTAVAATGHVIGAATNPVNAGSVNVVLDGISVQNSSIDGAGNFSYSNVNLMPGRHTFTAAYAGNGGAPWSGSNSASAEHAVSGLAAPAGSAPSAGKNPQVSVPPTFTITTSPASPSVGDQVTIVMVANTLGGITPTGGVRPRVNHQLVSGGTGFITLDGSGQATFLYGQFSGGTFVLSLDFLSGDANYSSAGDAGSTNVTVGKANTTASVSSSPLSPINYGQTVTINGTVSGPGAPIIGGTANVQDNAGASVWPGGGNMGVLVVNDAVTPIAVGPASLFSAGDHPITVTYLGDASNNPSPVSPVYHLVVNPAPSATTLTGATSSLSYGSGPVVFTASVAVLASAGNPPGTVTFFDSGAVQIPGCVGVAVTAANPAIATCTVTFDGSSSPKGVGSHSYTAQYTPGGAGSGNYASSTSGALAFTVAKGSPQGASFAININPVITTYGGAVPQAPQGPIRVTMVPLAGLATPTGTVTLTGNGLTLGTFTLTGGVATITIPQLPAGLVAGNGQTLGITYNGDANYNAGAASGANTINVAKATPVLTLGSNLNPSTLNQQVGFVVTATYPVGQPTGTADLFDGATKLNGSATPLVNGAQTFNISSLTAGAHNMTATYNGDTNFNAATTSPVLVQTVNTPTPPTPPSGNPGGSSSAKTDITLIASNPNPSITAPVTYIFRVTGGSTPPQGTVTVTDTTNGVTTVLADCTLVPVTADSGSSTSSSSGYCLVSYNNKDPQHSAGVHQLTATFSPASGGSWTNATSNTVMVGKPTTSVSQPTVAPGIINFGMKATFSAVVSPTNALPNFGSLTVQFYDNGTPLGNPVTPNAATGVASWGTSTPMSMGNHNITAQFIGDANYSPSPMSPILALTVTPVPVAPKITVVNSASNLATNFAPDSFASIFGDNLANTQLTAATVPYPTSLGGTTVNVTDSTGTKRPAPMYFVSSGQVNVLIPANTATGQATITLTNASGVSTTSTILIAATSPGIFSANASGQGVAAALVQRVKPDNSQVIENVAVFDSASKAYVPAPIVAGTDSLYLQLYGTGIRHTAILSNVTCTINGINAQVLYASLAPGFEGLDQVNVKVPNGLIGAGTVNVVVTVDGQTANVVTLTFGK
jgi:uncharacterized protein (TIGR03437 family)